MPQCTEQRWTSGSGFSRHSNLALEQPSLLFSSQHTKRPMGCCAVSIFQAVRLRFSAVHLQGNGKHPLSHMSMTCLVVCQGLCSGTTSTVGTSSTCKCCVAHLGQQVEAVQRSLEESADDVALRSREVVQLHGHGPLQDLQACIDFGEADLAEVSHKLLHLKSRISLHKKPLRHMLPGLPQQCPRQVIGMSPSINLCQCSPLHW